VSYIIKKIILTFTIFPVFLLATALKEKASETSNMHSLATYYTLVGDLEKKYNTLMEEKLKTIGFNLTDPHKRVNDQYETKWGSTVLDVLSFMPIVKDSTILPLLNIDPRIAGFAPFNIVIHKKLDENVSYVGHLVPEVMLNILGIENQEVRSKFTEIFTELDTTITKELGVTPTTIPYKKLPKKRMINFEYNFEEPEDIDEFIDEFQNKIELAFIDKGYLIAGFHNFMEATDDAETILEEYDAFWTYSLCHLEFSYNVFDNKGARPEAGLFAPCTMYMYIRKGTNKVVIGMFRLHNWSDTLKIEDEKRLSLIEQLDIEIPEILTAYGMKATPNINPLLEKSNKVTKKLQENNFNKINKDKTFAKKSTQEAIVKPKKIPKQETLIQKNTQYINIDKETVEVTLPKVPKAIPANATYTEDRSIKFSKRIPPNYVPHSFDKAQKQKVYTNTRIGEVNKGKISAYLRGKEISVKSVKEKLTAAGFEIITDVPITKKGDLVSVVFSNKAMISMASKPNRGFIASLRVIIDTKEKSISITNPLYLSKSFMQNDFDEKVAKEILAKLIIAFPNLTNSKDMLKYRLLSKYQFMKGMPHYENMIEVASGDNLLEKLKDNKNVVFIQTLENSATLIGIKLSKRTTKFIKRIGRNNAGMLPYPILIKDGKAKILDPKYYISIMYPMLTMSEFMTIATVPDAMKKDCEKIFK